MAKKETQDEVLRFDTLTLVSR